MVCAERGCLAPRLGSLTLENHKCVASECPQGGQPEPMQILPVQHPLATALALHILVAALLYLPHWLPPKVPRIGHP